MLLALVAVGLAGYAAWRLTRAALGHGPEGSDSGSDRIAALGSGIVYAGLCVVAIKVLMGSAGSSSGQTHKATAGVLGWPAGTWLVGIAGVVLCGIGLYQGYRALSRDFLEDAKVEQMSRRVKDAYELLGMFGYLARMLVFVLVGRVPDPGRRGLRPAGKRSASTARSRKWRTSPTATSRLGIVAAGLIAFGLYSLADARYRRI